MNIDVKHELVRIRIIATPEFMLSLNPSHAIGLVLRESSGEGFDGGTLRDVNRPTAVFRQRTRASTQRVSSEMLDDFLSSTRQ